MGGDLFGIGFGELLFLAILALLVFGPRRLPELARTLGRFVRQFRQAAGGIDREVRGWVQELEQPEERPAQVSPVGPEVSSTTPGGPPPPPDSAGGPTSPAG